MSNALLSMSAHEMRNALNAIVGFGEVLVGGMAGPLVPLQRQYLGEILAGGHRLRALIDDLVAIERIDAGHLPITLESLWPGPVVEDVRVDLAPVAHARGVALLTGVQTGLPALQADPVQLKNALGIVARTLLALVPSGDTLQLMARGGEGRIEITLASAGCRLNPDKAAPLFFEPVEFPGAGEAGADHPSVAAPLLAQRLLNSFGASVEAQAAPVPEPGCVFVVSMPAA
jgi:two-component system sensor histidine kinase BaeS